MDLAFRRSATGRKVGNFIVVPEGRGAEERPGQLGTRYVILITLIGAATGRGSVGEVGIPGDVPSAPAVLQET